MMERVRNTDDETLGLRMYEVSKERAVERCIQRWRHGLRADWMMLSRDEIEDLRWIAGQLWASRSREAWDELHFSKLDLARTKRIALDARRLRLHRYNHRESLEAIAALIEAAKAERSLEHRESAV